MDLYKRIQKLAKQQKISIRRLEEVLGFGNGVINRWRSTTPGIDKITKVADFFKVSVDYLLGREQERTTDLNQILDYTEIYNGKKMTQQDIDAVRAFLEGRFSKD